MNKKFIFSIFVTLLFIGFTSACTDSISTFLHFEDDFSVNTLEVTQGDLVNLVSIIYSYNGPLWMEKLEIVGENTIYTKYESGTDKTYFHLFTSTDTLNTNSLPAGTYTIRLSASTQNDCSTETDELTLIVQALPDTTEPELEITYPVDGETYTSHVTELIFDVYDENLDYCEYKINDGSWMHYSATNGLNTIPNLNSIEGTNVWSVKCFDDSGNENTDTTTFIVDLPEVDTTQPLVEITSPIDGGTYTEFIDEATFEVTEENLDFCHYLLNGGSLVILSSSQEGTNTIPNLNTIEGENTLLVRCYDDSGNSGVDEITFTIDLPDTTDPTLEITYPENGETYSSHITELVFDVYDENLESCQYKINSNSWTTYSGAENGVNTVTTVTSIEGENTWKVECEDEEGNDIMDTVTFYVVFSDTEAPVVEITYPESTTYTSHTTQIKFTVDDDNLNYCTYSLNGEYPKTITNPVNGENTGYSTSQEGTNLLIVKCYDDEGNKGEDSLTFTVDLPEVDETDPVVDITYPTEGTTYTSHVTQMKFDLVEENLDYCTYQLNGGTIKGVLLEHEGTNTIRWITSIEGENTWKVTCYDDEGNSGSDIVNFIVDLPDVDETDPELEITYPVNGATYTSHVTELVFQVYDENLKSCSYNLGTSGGAYPATNGVNTIDDITSIEGENTWVIHCEDEEGNSADDSVTFYVVFPEEEGPTVEIIYPINGAIYDEYQTFARFNVIEDNLDYCWYIIDNSTPVTFNCNDGLNILSNLTSNEGENIWTIYAIDTEGRQGFDTVKFYVEFDECEEECETCPNRRIAESSDEEVINKKKTYDLVEDEAPYQISLVNDKNFWEKFVFWLNNLFN